MIIKEYIILEPETEEEFFMCKNNYVSMIIGVKSKNGFPCFKIIINELERYKNLLEQLEEKGFIRE